MHRVRTFSIQSSDRNVVRKDRSIVTSVRTRSEPLLERYLTIHDNMAGWYDEGISNRLWHDGSTGVCAEQNVRFLDRPCLKEFSSDAGCEHGRTCISAWTRLHTKSRFCSKISRLSISVRKAWIKPSLTRRSRFVPCNSRLPDKYSDWCWCDIGLRRQLDWNQISGQPFPDVRPSFQRNCSNVLTFHVSLTLLSWWRFGFYFCHDLWPDDQSHIQLEIYRLQVTWRVTTQCVAVVREPSNPGAVEELTKSRWFETRLQKYE